MKATLSSIRVHRSTTFRAARASLRLSRVSIFQVSTAACNRTCTHFRTTCIIFVDTSFRLRIWQCQVKNATLVPLFFQRSKALFWTCFKRLHSPMWPYHVQKATEITRIFHLLITFTAALNKRRPKAWPNLPEGSVNKERSSENLPAYGF